MRIFKHSSLLRRNEQKCDFIIKVGKDDIFVHRKILKEKSDFFNAMLSHETMEKKSGIVVLKELELDQVNECVDCIYGQVASFTLEKIEQVLYVASLLQITTLLCEIGAFLQDQLDPKSCLFIRKIAEKFVLNSVVDRCDKVALESLEMVVKEVEFNELEMEYISYLIKSKKSIHPGREDSKLAIILQWMNADVRNRHQHLSALLNLLNLDKISRSYRRYIAENETACFQSMTCKELLHLDEFSSNKHKGRRKTDVQGKPADICFEVDPNAILYFDRRSKCLTAYRPSKRSWSRVCSLHLPDHRTVVAVSIYEFVYIFTKRKLYRLDITQENPQLVLLEYPPQNLGEVIRATSLGEFIYVRDHKFIARYDSSENKWEMIDFDIKQLVGHSLFTLNNFVYCMETSNRPLLPQPRTIYKFSPRLNSWSRENSGGIGFYEYAAVAVLRDRIYVADTQSNKIDIWGRLTQGRTPSITVECYDTKYETWLHRASLKMKTRAVRLCVIEGKLYITGIGAHLGGEVAVYDDKNDKWNTLETGTKAARFIECLPVYLPK